MRPPGKKKWRPGISATTLNLAAALAITGLTAAAGISVSENTGGDENRTEPRRFADIYEPSGVQQLPDGRIVVVEDEKRHSISLLTLRDNNTFASQPLKPGSLLDVFVGKSTLGKLSDLEGIDADDDNNVYAITSHSRTLRGNFAGGREKLVRFKVRGNRIIDPRVIRNLKKRIIKKHQVLRDAVSILKIGKGRGFNIEGLSFDRKKEKLLIGLRSPVIDDKAVIVVMENPAAAFERGQKPKIAKQLVMLDLDKGGIRAIVFDQKLGGYLILSRREDKRHKNFKLWFWDGEPAHAPRRIRIPHQKDLHFAEGITPIRQNGRDRILIVFDDGSTFKRKGGHYILLSYGQLKIDGAAHNELSAVK